VKQGWEDKKCIQNIGEETSSHKIIWQTEREWNE